MVKGERYTTKRNKKVTKGKSYFPVKANDMSRYLEQNTKQTFTDDPNELVKRALRTRTKYAPESLHSIVKNTGHLVTVELRENNKLVSREVNVGADVEHQNVYYYNKETEKIEQKKLNVRKIGNHQQMVDDINWLGLRGVLQQGQAGDPYEYYRFGDWVISFNLRDFYVGDHFLGRISDELPKDIKVLKYYSKSGTKRVTYNDMKNRLDGKFPTYTAKLWIDGNNDQVAKKTPKIDEGCLTLAMFVSESIRNFRTQVINMMAIEMIEDTKLTTKEFLDNHPMARGGTWPNPSKTGFEGLNSENKELVLPGELSLVR